VAGVERVPLQPPEIGVTPSVSVWRPVMVFVASVPVNIQVSGPLVTQNAITPRVETQALSNVTAQCLGWPSTVRMKSKSPFSVRTSREGCTSVITPLRCAWA
jgi:hypothetical protein